MNFKGKVYLFESYKFTNGTSKNKLLVFLNNGSLEKNFLVLLTTSQSNYFKKKGIISDGCFSEYNVFVYNGIPFDRRTYIMFNPDSIKLLKYSEVIKSSMDGFLKSNPIGEIPENILKGIINCFKKSDDYVEGIYNSLLD